LQPKFLTFLQCSFDTNWQPTAINYLSPEQQFIIVRMSPLKCITESGKIQLLDMSYKEVKIEFKLGSIVGVGSGMLFCDAEDIIDTTIQDAPINL
jgi:hypothetical protein